MKTRELIETVQIAAPARMDDYDLSFGENLYKFLDYLGKAQHYFNEAQSSLTIAADKSESDINVKLMLETRNRIQRIQFEIDKIDLFTISRMVSSDDESEVAPDIVAEGNFFDEY